MRKPTINQQGVVYNLRWKKNCSAVSAAFGKERKGEHSQSSHEKYNKPE